MVLQKNNMHFTKMQSLGNDFVVVDNTKGEINFSKKAIQRLAHRNFGIGFDQLLVVESNTTDDADFDYIIYNADGNQVEQCGNGARCFAKYVYDNGLTTKTTITVKTLNKVINLSLNNASIITAGMGKAHINPDTILTTQPHSQYTTIESYKLGLVDIGNPHGIYITQSLANNNVQKIGTAIQKSKLLKNGINVNIVEIKNRSQILLETYERGSGHTLACGTGACASVAFLNHIGKVDKEVMVTMRGGTATVTLSHEVLLSGPAKFVFTGEIDKSAFEYT